ncbi:ComE operon protein 1 [compost metagenome]
MKLFFAALLSLLFSVAALAAVNANTASQQELESLNGIGPVKAKAIIDYRTKNGPFKSYADLENVPGIGAKTLEKLKADLLVGGGTAKAVTKAPAAKPAATGKPTVVPAPAPAKKP